MREVFFGSRAIGPGRPCLVIAEIGINHSGSLQWAIHLIDGAKAAGADAVKFQAGDPERYVNRSAWGTPRTLIDGTVVSYIEYRKMMELSDADFDVIDQHCKSIGLPWFVSPLDACAVDRFERFDLPAYKVASPKLTDHILLQCIALTRRPALMSTGMSSFDDINRALRVFAPCYPIALLHTTSAYPCPDTAINLRALQRMQERYPDITVGYSGHESGLWPTLAAVSLGASVVERHFTLDRASWGSDQAASLEPSGFSMLVRGIRSIEAALSGDGEKCLRENEMANYRKFRSVA